jgi:hypothetical protein
MVTDEELWDILYECHTELVFNQGAEGHFDGWSDKRIQAHIRAETNLLFNSIKSNEAQYAQIIHEDREIVKQAFQNVFRKDQSFPVDISSIPQ